jgi:hypothetical protein
MVVGVIKLVILTPHTHQNTNSKLYNSKFCDLDLSLNLRNLRTKEEKFIQIYLVISETLKIRNSKGKSAV